YKAHRKETPEGLRPQFAFLKEVLDAFAVPHVELARYEADDLIASIACQAEKKEWEIQIYTGDRDALQLISPLTKVFLTKKGVSEVECYDEQALWDRYQLKPAQIIDLKGLMGDASDNIPGIPGVGEKTALKLLWEFGGVEEVLAHSQQVSGKKLQSLLQEYREQALLSKRLATMYTDVPMEISLESFIYAPPPAEKVVEIFDKYHLRNIKRIWQDRYRPELPQKAVAPAETRPHEEKPPQGQQVLFSEFQNGWEQQNAQNAQELRNALNPWPVVELTEDAWMAKLNDWREQKQQLVLTYQYQGTSVHQGVLQTWGIAAEGESYSLEAAAGKKVRDAWFKVLRDPRVPKITVDYKSLLILLRNEGADIQGLQSDLALAAYLLEPTRKKFAPLDLVRGYDPSREDFPHIAQEAAFLAQIAVPLLEDIKKYGLLSLLENIEQPLSRVLADMELQGISVDKGILHEFKLELQEGLAALEKDIHELAGEPFNINSPQQLGGVLFEKLALPTAKKTKRGYSTDADTLEELRASHPVIEKILDYRQLSKLMSTYVSGLLAQERGGRIHTTFQQTVTATGRLSSTDPNLQNIPIRLEYGRQLRKVFRPTEEDWLLLSADYSQIELRILAHYSQDELLIEAFQLDQDVHTRTAAEVFGVSLAEVTPDLRRKAKAVNFGLIYGLTDFGLARDLGIPRKEAKYYIEQYFARYGGVKRYLDEVVAKTKTEGQVRTLLNRLRRVPELYAANHAQRQFGERIAMNTPIQGTAADIMKIAMIDVAQALQGSQAALLLQVHDELVLQVAASEQEKVAGILKAKMEGALILSVPLKADCKIGANWYEMQPYPPS
ncbi:MAG: DNA polymerase I, partial [Peptococcaceae bacterium]|nr:DNA polymerase I [Peptococcaceae bacterium]